MRPLSLLIIATLLSIAASAQTTPADAAEPYDYDTTLRGGYTISFNADDSLQYLYLKKGSRTIIELSATSKGMLYKNLGYKAADFKGYFILAHSFGSGNPHYIELVKKATGGNILKAGAAWIDADEKKELLLYSENDVPGKKDKMILLNIKTGQKKYLPFPNDIFDAPQVLGRIQIKSISEKQLIITYETEKGSKLKAYNR